MSLVQTAMNHRDTCRVEQSRTCLFPTSVSQLHSNTKKFATAFLNGHPYTFGDFDVGSLDLGRYQNIGSSRYIGAFRSEGVSGDGYFAREILMDASELPHYLPLKEFEKRRNAVTLSHAGIIPKLPKEIRDIIYEFCCMPDEKPHGSGVYKTTPAEAMLLNLSSTCSFLHEEVTTFLYRRHVFYLNTPARLANFTNCLSFGTIPPPRRFGTIILEIRKFEVPNSEAQDVRERDYGLAAPYENFQHLSITNPHFRRMRNEELKHTRDWNGHSYGADWGLAIKGLMKHKVRKLIVKAELGSFEVWNSGGRLLRALELVGDRRIVEKVTIDLGGQAGMDVPQQVATDVAALKNEYEWE